MIKAVKGSGKQNSTVGLFLYFDVENAPDNLRMELVDIKG
jgi:hypothetical protein